ncbi:hypothetical protein [Streptomyces sp. NPDC037389]|uniref:hypothetical protein n=1 Tax=Streptomyces sp. NPDC037389 TaxID=3155369 RepID=UPI0033C27700
MNRLLYGYRTNSYASSNCLSELNTSWDVDEPSNASYFFPPDGRLYIGHDDKAEVYIYNKPVSGTRKGRKDPTFYHFSDDWKEGITDLAVGQAKETKKFFALSRHVDESGHRLLFAGTMTTPGTVWSPAVDPTIKVHGGSRFVAVDPSNGYVFVGGDRTLQRLNLMNPSGSLVDFPGVGMLCCPPVFCEKGGTVYCCTVENNDGQLQSVRYKTTDPSSREPLTVVKTTYISAGAAVDPETQNLWVIRAKNPTTLNVFEIDPVTPAILGTFTQEIPGELERLDQWITNSCYAAMFVS